MDLAWLVAIWAMVVFGILFGLLLLISIAATIWVMIAKVREEASERPHKLR